MKSRHFNPFGKYAPQAEFLLLLGLAMYRLYLTADRDIAAWNAPHDEFWYVNKAFTGVWAGQYNEMSFVHSPIYALWLEFLNTYGIPARLGIDVAWIAGVIFLAVAVRNFTKSRFASVVLAAFLLLHPYTVFIFDRSLAETLLGVTVAIWLAAGLEIWTSRNAAMSRRRVMLIVLFSVMFAASYAMRKEGISLAAPLILLAGLTLFFRGFWWSRSKSNPSLGTIYFVLPFFATICLTLALSTLNYAKWGTFAPYDLANSGYKRAIASLSGIDAGRTPLQVSVTMQMLEKAYSVSPTLRELKPQMDGPVGGQWIDLSTSIGAQGEIGSGWFYWALRDAAARAGWHSSAPMADQKYHAVANEINDAFEKGILKKRQSLVSSFVDPDVQKWLPSLPSSFIKVVRLSVLPLSSDVVLPMENATQDQFNEYVWVVGRRSPMSIPSNSTKIAYLADGKREGLVRLSQIMSVALLIFLLLGILSAILASEIDHVWTAACICLFFCITRVALFALLDASSWNGEQARYMIPLLPFLACASVLGMTVLFNRIQMLAFHANFKRTSGQQ